MDMRNGKSKKSGRNDRYYDATESFSDEADVNANYDYKDVTDESEPITEGTYEDVKSEETAEDDRIRFDD